MHDVHITGPLPPTQHNHKGWRSAPDAILPRHWRAPQWVPARTPTVHWGPNNGEAVGGPHQPPERAKCRTHQTVQNTSLQTNMVAEHVTIDDKDKLTDQLVQKTVEVPQEKFEQTKPMTQQVTRRPGLPQERTQERIIVEEIIDVMVPQVTGETFKVVETMPQERVQNRTVERVVTCKLHRFRSQEEMVEVIQLVQGGANREVVHYIPMERLVPESQNSC